MNRKEWSDMGHVQAEKMNLTWHHVRHEHCRSNGLFNYFTVVCTN